MELILMEAVPATGVELHPAAFIVAGVLLVACIVLGIVSSKKKKKGGKKK